MHGLIVHFWGSFDFTHLVRQLNPGFNQSNKPFKKETGSLSQGMQIAFLRKASEIFSGGMYFCTQYTRELHMTTTMCY